MLDWRTDAGSADSPIDVLVQPLLEPAAGGVMFGIDPVSLDPSNRLQFRGCLEDWKVDHVRLDVESMREQ